VLVMTSRAFDFIGRLPPIVKHVGPRLDDIAWVGEWTAPPGDDPLVLVVVHAGAGLPLEPSTTSGEIAAAARHVLADDTHRRAAERIAAVIAEETATDLAVAEIEAVLATALQPA
jgi:hypothetical protein